MTPIELADRLGIERVVDAARQRPREDDHVCSAREVVDLSQQHRELVGLDVRAPLVDLRVRGRRRIDDRRRRAGFVRDAHEVVEDRLRRELLDDPCARPAAGKAGRDDGNVEPLQRTGDVDPLAAGQRQALARAVALPELDVRHRQRAVDRGVERDGDDHVNQFPIWRKVRPT